MITALHDHRWESALDELAARDDLDVVERALVTRATEVTAHRALAAGEALSELVGQLSESGIPAAAGDDPIRIDGRVVIRVEAAVAPEASAALERLGYISQHALSPGAWQAWSKVSHELVFLPIGETRITRVALQWRARKPQGRLARLASPSSADLRAFSLPGTMWWAYWAIKPLRVLAERLTGRRRILISPYLSTPTPMVEPLLDLVGPAADDRVVDLGCGDGRVLIEAALRFGCQGLGVESDRRLASQARMAVAEANLEERIVIEEGDVRNATLQPGDIVFLFLPTAHAAKLLPGLFDRVGPGGRILAHEQTRANWPIPADRSHLVIDASGVTVAHVWER